ncbi:hypothetical protein EJ03DRAFT_331554 [Teratosphaeria nubilosa]|uniref:Uncharacterized protein n=1 Tax=Teratosphaeria nubilosa TaxID=161662 RepID=A0A6G1KWI0_9PEZI|nr:hypothetical protein EJ03DRAFT_331554 [Teratosphaeria nubilosa]
MGEAGYIVGDFDTFGLLELEVGIRPTLRTILDNIELNRQSLQPFTASLLEKQTSSTTNITSIRCLDAKCNGQSISTPEPTYRAPPHHLGRPALPTIHRRRRLPRALMLTCRALYAESKDLPAQIHPAKCRVTVWPPSKEYAFLPNLECGRKGQPLIMTETLGPIGTCRILKEAREVDVHLPKGLEDNGEVKASVETIMKSMPRREVVKVHAGR